MDMDWVISGAPWTFTNHLLVIHQLESGEDPVKVPLVFANFLVQVHELPTGIFLKFIVRQLEDFIGKFLEYDSKSLSRGVRNFFRIKVQLDIRRPLKWKKNIMFASENCTYVSFKYERLTIFCFYCGCLRHNDSFCHIRMSKGEEESVELGWDLSLRVQSRRAAVMHSVWLIE
ncbi:hypothetical protein PVK06_012383 [Gossypium arboreum]|uniref:Zinc knuckle CX2CX4HX4C domain-containing protein n=1 Tax=Gossypium arboreum TaxID=29729 RepID=A0ABR0QBA2_GOSAR|nr:hypothetical protein PVK06_012383 [Gossypium arboreum]